MLKVYLFLCCFLIFFYLPKGLSQNPDSLKIFTGSIYDFQENPLPFSHVINLQTKSGTTTDSSGFFQIKAKFGDILLVKNLAFIDTSIIIGDPNNLTYIQLSQRKYSIPEVKIFEWGSTYGDFKQALLKMPMKENLAEKLHLPTQDPNIIPYYLNSELLSSAGFLFISPIDFLYQNLNKTEISRRKVYELIKNKEMIDNYNNIYSYENISSITGLKDQELFDFLAWLETRFECDYHCSEMQIITELLNRWKNYKENILPSKHKNPLINIQYSPGFSSK
jgi:hypothetical protein